MAPQENDDEALPAKPLTPAQKRLVESLLPDIQHGAESIARDLRGLVEPRELLAAGTFGAMEAAGRYEEARHPSFRHFARCYVMGRMWNSVRAEHFAQHVRIERAMERAYYRFAAGQVLEFDLFSDSEEEMLEGSRIGADDAVAAALIGAIVESERINPEDAIVLRISLREALPKLYAHELEVIRLLYYEGLTQAEAAKKLRVPDHTVQYRHAMALEKLRDALLGPDSSRPKRKRGPGGPPPPPFVRR